MHPIDVATTETVEFLLRHLSPQPLRILEVGCGTGEVAARLQGYHHHVIAIDSEAKAIEQAQQLGVDARLAVWPLFEESAFDAILFTRSLHHIAPLDVALSHASQLLLPSGVLLVEDFAYNEMDPPTLSGCMVFWSC